MLLLLYPEQFWIMFVRCMGRKNQLLTLGTTIKKQCEVESDGYT